MAQNTTKVSLNPWVAFVCTAVAASLWLAAIAAIPGMQNSGLPLTLSRIVVQLLILGGMWAGLSRTSLSLAERRSTWLAIALPLTVWHGLAWTIVAKGMLMPGVTRIPLLPLMIVVPTAIVITLLLRSRRIGVLLDATPASWLVGLQAYRVIGGVFFLDWLAGFTPVAFAIPAGTGDVITGLMALPTAIVLTNWSPRSARAAVLWNLFGMADLVVAVILGALTSRGPLQHLAFDHPNLITGMYPTAIIPAFTVPTSLVLHALSLRQLSRRARSAAIAV